MVQSLIYGHTRSCGCVSRARSTKHGMHGTPTYESWRAMRKRCEDSTHHAFSRYGGRGITVCAQWKDFARFYADMGDRPSKRHTLERIDNSKGYEPGNCCWADWHSQARNRRNNRLIAYDGVSATAPEWAERTGIPYYVIKSRIASGWSVSDALSKPTRKISRKPAGTP